MLQKMKLAIKVVKRDSKIIIWLSQSISTEQTAENMCGYIGGCVCFFKCVYVCICSNVYVCVYSFASKNNMCTYVCVSYM